MIKVIQKDITTVEAGIIAHGVNCQRKMGSGVALAIKNKWPAVYTHYMRMPGGPDMVGKAYGINVGSDFNLCVFNCYTQEWYGPGDRKYASTAAINKSLTRVFQFANEAGLDVYLPKIGAGLGGLDWDTEVLPIVELIDTAYNLNNTTYICEWE